MKKSYLIPDVKIVLLSGKDCLTVSGEALIKDSQGDGLFSGGFES